MKLISCIILLLAMPLITIAGELEERQQVRSFVADMFLKEEFQKLSDLSKKYLETEERTSSGLWKLTLFYAGIGDAVNKRIRDENYWNDLDKKALKWVDAQPQSPSGYIAYAMIQIERGWMYRGNGWASNVKKESWRPFYECLEKAKQYLGEHYEIASNDPRWYETMLVVALGEGWDMGSFELLVDEATTKFPYFYQLYFVAIDYLSPKWHGSKSEIEKFAQKAVNITSKKEKAGMYARVYWYASQSNYGIKLFTQSAVTWSHMSRAIDDVLVKYPDQWNINNFAYFACLAGDKEKTSSLVSQIKGEPIKSVWKNMRFYDRCKYIADNNSK